MPLADPNALTGTDWIILHKWLTFLWIFFPLIITFAFSMMVAHAFIPSGVATGDYPPALSRLRLPLTILGLLALAAALVLFIMAAFMTPEMLNRIWPRYFL